ncbi:MAG: DNA polymerase III subunit gamma/tau [Sedimentisphaerales bacterium]|nr:DNA polymerase III subunit gamma/tau [Sedimentisphaerales bacterium]
MSYTVLARRFRSQTFDDVVGQDAVAQTLKNAIKTGRVAHAYLFCGTRGVGKTTMARILAKSLNCLKADGPTTTPCLVCDSCVAINTGDDIDVIEIDGASNRGIDNIRELRQNAIYRPARARYKIYIVDEVHMLTTEAFNALLKILEEPPAHVKFIFATTEPNKVLPTIQSRCQRFDFSAISPEVIGKQLAEILGKEGIAFEQDFLMQLSRLANGSMRDALSLLDQLISSGTQPLTLPMLEQLLGRPGAENLNALIQSIAAADPAAVLKSIESLSMQGQSASQVAEAAVELFRDMMVIKAAGVNSPVLLLSGVSPAKLVQLGDKFDIPWLVFSITALERLRWTLRNSETARALLEATFLRLAMSEHFLGLDAVSQQIRSGTAPAAAAGDVKKKFIVPPANTPSSISTEPAAADHPQAAVNSPLFDGAVDAQSIVQQWPQIIERIRASNFQIGSFLSQTQPGEFRNGMLTIQFHNDGKGQLAIDMCRKKTDVIESVLKDALGQAVHVKFESAQLQTAKAATPAATPGARLNRKEEEQVMSDPAVQMLLQGLSARPIKIERLEVPEEQQDLTEETEL